MALNGLIPVHPGDNRQKMHTPKMEHFAKMGRR